MVETIKKKAAYSWDGQRSDNPDVQRIIEHGFWVDEVKGNLCTAYLDKFGSSEPDVFASLPRMLYIKDKGNKGIKVVFEIDEI